MVTQQQRLRRLLARGVQRRAQGLLRVCLGAWAEVHAGKKQQQVHVVGFQGLVKAFHFPWHRVSHEAEKVPLLSWTQAAVCRAVMQLSQQRTASAFHGWRRAAEDAAATKARLRCAVHRLGALRAAAVLRAWHEAVTERQATELLLVKASRSALSACTHSAH